MAAAVIFVKISGDRWFSGFHPEAVWHVIRGFTKHVFVKHEQSLDIQIPCE